MHFESLNSSQQQEHEATGWSQPVEAVPFLDLQHQPNVLNSQLSTPKPFTGDFNETSASSTQPSSNWIQAHPKPGTPTVPTASEEAKLFQRYKQLVVDGDALAKDVEVLETRIESYKTKLVRLRKLEEILTQAYSDLVSQKEKKSSVPKRQREEQSEIPSMTIASQDPSPEKPSKKKRKRDPNAPKHLINVYMVFCEIQRVSIAYEKRLWALKDPAGVSDQSQLLLKQAIALGQKWRLLNDQDKKMYRKLFLGYKAVYEREMSEYKTLSDNEKVAFKESNGGETKPVINAFSIYCEKMDQNIESKGAELNFGPGGEEELENEIEKAAVVYATRWRLMNQKERDVYEAEFSAAGGVTAASHPEEEEDEILGDGEEEDELDEEEEEEDEMEGLGYEV